MSVSQSSEIPLLAGGFITLDTVKSAPDTSNRRTKIVCTIGPACWEVPQLETLIESGMNVARLNFSHGNHEGHGAVLQRIRQASKNKHKTVGTWNPGIPFIHKSNICSFFTLYFSVDIANRIGHGCCRMNIDLRKSHYVGYQGP